MAKEMDKNLILTALNDWNFWNKDQETGIERAKYLNRIKKFVSTNQTLVITGARRAGKSFIMRQFQKDLIEKQELNKKDTLFINFEDPRLPKLSAQSLGEIYDVYLEKLNPSAKPFVFLDEVQEVKNWEKWVTTIGELKKANLVISGSNAHLLGKDLATLLTGRHLDITVFPLSFKEFLKFNNISAKTDLEIVDQKHQIRKYFTEYRKLGAFPEVVLAKQKKEILLEYLDDILNKDLIKRYNIRKPEKLKALARFYLSNVSNLITFNSLSNSLDISADTVEKFSGYLKDAYLVFFLKRFSFKVKEQEKSPRKVYCIDQGLANIAGFRFSENLGKIAENIVFLELKREQSRIPSLEFYYWKDKQHREVDFVKKQDKDIEQLIQVCWDLSNPKTKQRELKALLKASRELKCDDLLIITSEKEGEEKVEGKTIKYIPLWKWLLGE